MQLILGYEILESYKRLPYKPWFAFAEFVDNSTQSYRNHKSEMDEWFEETDTMLSVEISYANNVRNQAGYIQIKDNAFGMNLDELQNALTLGKKPAIHNERSKYGLGLKTAAFWFGNKWEIETTQKGSTESLKIEVDLHKILKAESEYYEKAKKSKSPTGVKQFRPDLKISKVKCAKDKHGTILTITDLVRSITPQTSKNCVEYLQSIYRIDLQNETLSLQFQQAQLSWNQHVNDSNLLKDAKGNLMKREFSFKINGKKVSGWAGVLSSGSKSSGGFSLLQADRVIVGLPKNYKNSLLFGAEEGGRNDLANQRLTGELKLDEKFGVSHTKDQIIFSDDEEEKLDKALFERLADYKKEANIPFKSRENKTTDPGFDFEVAIKQVINNLNTPTFREVLSNKAVLPEKVIVRTNEETVQRLLKNKHKEFSYKLDNVSIVVILSAQSSVWDPYLIIRSMGAENRVNIVINENHPYWMELADNKSRFNFLLSCIYDGVSEWKAGFKLKTLDPHTIKLIKDSLLRLELDLF